MSAGLTFVNTTEHPVKVLLNNAELNASQYDIVTDSTKAHTDCTFEIKIHDNVLSANDKITVTYYGQVNSSAVINGDNTNEANLTYGTDGNSTWEKTTTKVFGFKVFKHAGTDTEHLLPGAEFRLYKTVGGETHYAKFDANGLLTGWTTGATYAGVTMTSNSDSALVLNGLDAGTYYLKKSRLPMATTNGPPLSLLLLPKMARSTEPLMALYTFPTTPVLPCPPPAAWAPPCSMLSAAA